LGKQINFMKSDKGGECYGRYNEKGQLLGPIARFLETWHCCSIHNARLTITIWCG